MKLKTETDIRLESVRRIHMIGIGGAGMAPLAEILLARGYKLSGSDNNETDTLSRMRKIGIPISLGHSPENIEGAEMIVYSAAIMKDNPELTAAAQKGIPAVERSLLLGTITREFDRVFAVSGTHGKTTVSAMLSHILIKADARPSAVIGGRLPLIGANGIAGDSDILVCEACEYVDTFLQMSPDIAIILNIDNDHMEYFKTMENLKLSFRKFADSASKALIINGDDLNTTEAVKGLDKEVITFGFSKTNDYYPVNQRYSERKTEFELYGKGGKLADVSLSVAGEHNVLNATAAIASAIYAGVDAEKAALEIEDFTGAGRRFEILAEINGITIADDYAHHPAELKVTLKTAMNMHYSRVIAIFQPFTYSRTKMLMEDFAEVLAIPDITVLSEIMGSREKNTYGVYSSQLAEKIPDCVWFESFEEIAEHVVSIAKAGDLVITLGCGDIYKAAKIIVKRLKGN